MHRFFMPDNTHSISEKAESIRIQIRDFLDSEALKDLLGILETDIDTLGQTYNGRLRKKGAVIETQELVPETSLENRKEILYPLFRELGFIDINKPVRNKNNNVIVLGGSISACAERTCCAKRMLDETTRYVDGLACYRPVSPVERKAETSLCCDTEFGAMAESFVKEFDLNGYGYTEEFKGDRNLNSISCIRNYEKADGRTYRIFAAPSSEPDKRRADTGDTFRFYMEKCEQTQTEASILFITNNRYCNRQFLQLAYWMIEGKYPGTIDVVGCYPDESVISAEKYDPYQYLQDLIAIIDWAHRFSDPV